MKKIQGIQLIEGSNEELLPEFREDFPYIATCAELYKYPNPEIPWHWHSTAELFYMESGKLEYTTPNGKWVFTAGMGGFLKPNVLHTSRELPSGEKGIQLLHLFEPTLISGEQGNRMDRKYIRPLVQNSQTEMLVLSAEVPGQAEILRKIREAFELTEESWGYEFLLRRRLTEIWMALFEMARPDMESSEQKNESDRKIKEMLVYIHEHLYSGRHGAHFPGTFLDCLEKCLADTAATVWFIYNNQVNIGGFQRHHSASIHHGYKTAAKDFSVVFCQNGNHVRIFNQTFKSVSGHEMLHIDKQFRSSENINMVKLKKQTVNCFIVIFMDIPNQQHDRFLSFVLSL